MAAISLFDLMNVRDEPSLHDAVVARWPVGVVQAGIGRQDPPDTDAIVQLALALDASLKFRSIAPGADATRVGLIAEMHVDIPLPTQPIALARMPDVEFRLLATGSAPPKVFVTHSDAGTAIVIDALPVEIRLPRRMLMPLEVQAGDPVPLEDVQVSGFQSGFHDTLGITLRRDDVSSIFVHVKVRFTEAREVMVYSEVLDANRGKIVTDEVLVVEGKISNDEFSGGLRIIAERLLTLGEARSRFARALQLRVSDELASAGGAVAAAGKLQTLLEPFREGGCPIRVRYRNTAAEAELPFGDGWRVRLDDALLDSLREWLSPEAVEVVYAN